MRTTILHLDFHLAASSLLSALGHFQSASAQAVPHPYGSGPVHPNVGGCVNSPEAPTGFLLLVGGAGITLGGNLIRKVSRRKPHSASTPSA